MVEGDESVVHSYEDPRYKIYLQETSGYSQEKLEIFKIIPTFLVSISTFMFGGSIWALNAIQNPKHPRLLIATWICLGLSIALMMFELLFSLRAYERAGAIAAIRYRSGNYEESHKNSWASICEFLQFGTFFVFVVGIVTFLLFFSLNISTPRSSDGGPKTQSPAGAANTEKSTLSAARPSGDSAGTKTRCKCSEESCGSPSTAS